MNKITLAQRETLDVVKDMIDRSNTSVPEYGTKIMTLILGILNVDCRVGPVAPSITADPDKPDNALPIDYEGLRDSNDMLIVPEMPTPPFVPGDVAYPNQPPFPPQVWYNQETEPIQPTAQELRYATEVSCTGNKNGIVYSSNTADVRYNGDKDCITTRDVSDCTTYTGDFRDVQTSFNDK